MIRTSTAATPLNRRSVILAVAALLALGTGWLTLTYLNAGTRTSAATRTVVVALRDIPARSTISPGMIGLAPRPADGVDPDALTAPGSAAGAVARVTIPAGAVVSSAKIATHIDVGLTERLHAGKRAISIPIDRVKAVGNLIQPGDHVDVIALTRPAPGVAPKALTILRDTVVLAMGSTYESTTAGATPQGEQSTATLEVTPVQAKLLALADANTTLRLDLRTPREPAATTALDHLVLAAPPAPPVAPPAPAPPARTAADPPRPPLRARPPAVTVIDGDRIVTAP